METVLRISKCKTTHRLLFGCLGLHRKPVQHPRHHLDQVLRIATLGQRKFMLHICNSHTRYTNSRIISLQPEVIQQRLSIIPEVKTSERPFEEEEYAIEPSSLKVWMMMISHGEMHFSNVLQWIHTHIVADLHTGPNVHAHSYFASFCMRRCPMHM